MCTSVSPSEHAGDGAEVGGSEGVPLEAADEEAPHLLATARPNTWTGTLH